MVPVSTLKNKRSMEWIIYIVIFICLGSLLAQIRDLEKENKLTRKMLEALMWTLRQTKRDESKESLFDMDKMRESIEIGMGRVKPRSGSREDYLTIFGPEMKRFWTLTGFDDSTPYYKKDGDE